MPARVIQACRPWEAAVRDFESGVVVHWDEEKGYGFLLAERGKVFFHQTGGRTTTPGRFEPIWSPPYASWRSVSIGDVLYFRAFTDREGRAKAHPWVFMSDHEQSLRVILGRIQYRVVVQYYLPAIGAWSPPLVAWEGTDLRDRSFAEAAAKLEGDWPKLLREGYMRNKRVEAKDLRGNWSVIFS